MKSITILAVAVGLGLTTTAASAAPKSSKPTAQRTSDARAATRRLNEQQLAMAQGGVAGTPAMPANAMPGNSGSTLTPETSPAPMTSSTMTPPINPNDSGMTTPPTSTPPPPPPMGTSPTTTSDKVMGQTDGMMRPNNGQNGTTTVPPRR